MFGNLRKEGRWSEREAARGKSKKSSGVNIKFFTGVHVFRKEKGSLDLFEITGGHLLCMSTRQCEHRE